MSEETNSLRTMIELFLHDSAKTIYRIKQKMEDPTEDELNAISQRIWDLHYFSQRVLETKPSETLYYNAKIIKDLVEGSLSKSKVSLIKAADEMKKEAKNTHIKSVVLSLASHDKAREVLFEDLEEIANELAA